MAGCEIVKNKYVNYQGEKRLILQTIKCTDPYFAPPIINKPIPDDELIRDPYFSDNGWWGPIGDAVYGGELLNNQCIFDEREGGFSQISRNDFMTEGVDYTITIDVEETTEPLTFRVDTVPLSTNIIKGINILTANPPDLSANDIALSGYGTAKINSISVKETI